MQSNYPLRWSTALRRRSGQVVLAAVLGISLLASAAESLLLIDDRRSHDRRSALGAPWRLITDEVMGGVSEGQLSTDVIEGRSCLRLRGQVRTENRGGFVQAALDLERDGSLDGSAYEGILLDIYGNGQTYNVHLRTGDVWLPWQSYRASFPAPERWHTVRVPFEQFEAYRIGAALDLSRLERLGLVAIGRPFAADLCLGRLAFYRSPT